MIGGGKELSAEAFCITNTPFVVFVMKMAKHSIENGFGHFNLKRGVLDSEMFVFKEDQIAEPLTGFVEFTECRNEDSCLSAKCRVQQEFFKRLKVTRVHSVYDSLCFSSECMDDVETLLDFLNEAVEGKLFAHNSSSDSSCLSSWFDFFEPSTICEWVVSQFEMRVLRLFFGKDLRSNFPGFPGLIMRDFTEVWVEQSNEDRQSMIHAEMTRLGVTEPSAVSPLQPISPSDKVLRLILSQQPEIDHKTPDSIASAIHHRQQSSESLFIKESLFVSLEESFSILSFLMNCLVESIQALFCAKKQVTFEVVRHQSKFASSLCKNSKSEIPEEIDFDCSHHSTFISSSADCNDNKDSTENGDCNVGFFLEKSPSYSLSDSGNSTVTFISQVVKFLIEKSISQLRIDGDHTSCLTLMKIAQKTPKLDSVEFDC